YTLEHFREERPAADILAEIRGDGTLNLVGPNRDPRGGDGTTLISFAPEQPIVKEPDSEGDDVASYAPQTPTA
ncbi:MAG: sodium:proton antiporter, partial [Pseudomonadota bacterium]